MSIISLLEVFSTPKSRTVKTNMSVGKEKYMSLCRNSISSARALFIIRELKFFIYFI